MTRELSYRTVAGFLPSVIWTDETIWVPDSSMQGIYNIEDLRDSVFEASGNGEDIDRLTIEGSSLSEMVQAYDTEIGTAIGLGDFTRLLSLDRHFNL